MHLGVRFAIDDFGTGYSSLDQLLKLPIDAVKLDLSLIAKLGSDPRQSALVRSIHDLAVGGRQQRGRRRCRDGRSAG